MLERRIALLEEASRHGTDLNGLWADVTFQENRTLRAALAALREIGSSWGPCLFVVKMHQRFEEVDPEAFCEPWQEIHKRRSVKSSN